MKVFIVIGHFHKLGVPVLWSQEVYTSRDAAEHGLTDIMDESSLDLSVQYYIVEADIPLDKG